MVGPSQTESRPGISVAEDEERGLPAMQITAGLVLGLIVFAVLRGYARLR
jgi:hypothetical protein